MKKGIFGLLICILALQSSAASAFDNNRKGFLLSLGSGGGVSKAQKEELSDGVLSKDEKQQELSISGDLRFGYGFNDNLIIYVHAAISLYSHDTTNFGHGLQSLGLAYAPPPLTKLWLMAEYGRSTWNQTFESDAPTFAGRGFLLGLGWEFTPHWTMEAGWMHGSPDRIINILTPERTIISNVESTQKLDSLRVAVVWTAF